MEIMVQLKDDNRQIYEKEQIARYYVGDKTLLPSEIMIFIKYSAILCGGRVLDIGIGTGRTTWYLKDLAGEYTGVDYSSRMVEFSRKIFPGVHFDQCDARDLYLFKDNSLDFILFSYNGIDSIDHFGRLQAMGEIQRILRKGGLFVFSSHNRSSRKINYHPKLEFSRNPCRQAKHIFNYIISWRNFRKFKSKHYFSEDYDQITDRGHNYSLLHYYVDKSIQIRQLESIGFKVIDMYDVDGCQLKPEDDDSNSNWIYYVAEK